MTAELTVAFIKIGSVVVKVCQMSCRSPRVWVVLDPEVGAIDPLKICRRATVRFDPQNVTFFRSKLLLDNCKFHVIKNERLVSIMDGKTNFWRRPKQFDDLTWVIMTPYFTRDQRHCLCVAKIRQCLLRNCVIIVLYVSMLPCCQLCSFVTFLWIVFVTSLPIKPSTEYPAALYLERRFCILLFDDNVISFVIKNLKSRCFVVYIVQDQCYLRYYAPPPG